MGSIIAVYMSHGLKLGWGGPIGDYIGVSGGPKKGYATILVHAGLIWSLYRDYCKDPLPNFAFKRQ